MRPISEYGLLVFDCDGVIFDSNQLKIAAMRNALSAHCGQDPAAVEHCVAYFAGNFGKSRYHHVQHFVDSILVLSRENKKAVFDAVLSAYSAQCFSLYLKANTAPGLIDFIGESTAQKYVASGSDQAELRQVFTAREMTDYFVNIYGSPAKKTDIVRQICQVEGAGNALMIGDAISDFHAARDNGIDFLFYAPFSNVEQAMLALAAEHHFRVCYSFTALLEELRTGSGGVKAYE
jgi:phosphoglycolate phosphatase-like HAD superfamily hydrolase